MSCPFSSRSDAASEKRTEIKITLKREQLLHDIENYAYVAGDLMDEDSHGRHTTQDIARDGNEPLATRAMNLAVAYCAEELYPYTKRECAEAEATLTDELDRPPAYTIEMSVPQAFSYTTHTLLKELLHRFVVERVLYEWMMITNPEAAQTWRLRWEETKEKIEKIAKRPTGRVRIKPWPQW